jgi:hypothetical protein
MRQVSTSLANYRDPEPAPRPGGLDRWTLRYTEAPYRVVEGVRSEAELLSRLPPTLAPPRGPLLLATPAVVNPNHDFTEIDWLRGALPWVSLLVMVPNPAQTDPFGRRITLLARRGAIVIPREITDPSALASAVNRCTDPRLELAPWLGRVCPRWPPDERMAAVRRFLSGFQYDPEEYLASHPTSRLPSRGSLWFQVGRALRAVLEIQRRCSESWRRVSLEAGFANLRAMDRAVLRALGLRRQEIAGTVGWEWLLWRFLCGLGKGKAKAWDRSCPKKPSRAVLDRDF